MAELTICRKQRCPCGGEFSFFQSGDNNSLTLWHRDTDAYETRRFFRRAFFEQAGGMAVARDFVAARLNELHQDYSLATTGDVVYGTGVQQVPETIPNEGLPKPPALATTRKPGLRDSCACGGALGYDYDAARDGYVFRHENPGKTETRTTFLESAYLDQRGRTPMTALMAIVERWHVEGREQQEREEREAMLAQQRDPRNWPSIIGRRVVVTGTLERYDRKGIASAIADAGGYHEDKITRSTDLLVTGVRPGAIKVRDAKTYAIPTLGDGDFMKLLARSTSAKRQVATMPKAMIPTAAPTVVVREKINGFTGDGRPVTIDPETGEFVLTGQTVRRTRDAPARKEQDAPARRNPTFEELLERERWLRGDRD